MTDKMKMPVVGRDYIFRKDKGWNGDKITVTNIMVYHEDFEGEGGSTELSKFWDWFEEKPTVKENLTDDRMQVEIKKLRNAINLLRDTGWFNTTEEHFSIPDSTRHYITLAAMFREYVREFLIFLDDSNIPQKADIFERANPPVCSKCDRILVYTDDKLAGEAWQCEVCPGAKKEIKVILKEKPNCFRHNKQLINDLAGCEDCQEEKPKSIWKSVEELPAFCGSVLMKEQTGEIGFGYFGYGNNQEGDATFFGLASQRRDVDFNYRLKPYQFKEWCYLTDFINEYELQKVTIKNQGEGLSLNYSLIRDLEQRIKKLEEK